MPLYDYACTKCGRTVEVMHGVHGHGPAVCEVCGGSMRKLLSAPAIVFKGSGWAKKDARSAAHAKTAKAPSEQTAGGTDSGSKPKAAESGAASGGATAGSD